MAETQSSSKGQALVEISLLLPIVIVIVMGAVDFGRAFFAYTALVNAAREGAMCASLGPACAIDVDDAVAFETEDTLTGAIDVTVSPSPMGGPGTNVTVTVEHDFQAITTAILSEVTFPLTARATMVVQ